MKQVMKICSNNPKLIATIHTIVAIAISIVCILFNKELAKDFLISSFVFNIYLRLLYFNFANLEIPQNVNTEDDQESKSKPNPLVVIFSSLRALLVAAVLAVFILKFNFNLWAIACAFIIYKLVLIGVGFYSNGTYNRTDIRQNS